MKKESFSIKSELSKIEDEFVDILENKRSKISDKIQIAIAKHNDILLKSIYRDVMAFLIKSGLNREFNDQVCHHISNHFCNGNIGYDGFDFIQPDSFNHFKIKYEEWYDDYIKDAIVQSEDKVKSITKQAYEKLINKYSPRINFCPIKKSLLKLKVRVID